MRNTSLAVSITHVPRYLGLAFLSIALISLPLSPTYSENPQSADQAAERAKIKQEYNRMKTEAALFNAYMEQLARVDATDFGNEAAVRAQLERLDRFKPDDVGKGFISSLVVTATRNQKFREGVKQKAEEPGAKEFFEAMGKDPGLVTQIRGADDAEGDVVRFSDGVKAKVESVKNKLGVKAGAQRGDIGTGDTRFAALDSYLDGAIDLISALFLIGEAKAEVATIMTLLTIMLIASVIILVIDGIVIVVYAAYQLYQLLDMAQSHYKRTRQSYSNCYYSALRNNTSYWNREFAKAVCWIAFFGDW